MPGSFRHRLLLFLMALFGAASSYGFTDDYRTWTDRQGRQIEARMVHFRDGTVTIRKRNLREFDVPLEQFSAEDQRHVILSVYRLKYEEAKETLEEYLKKEGEKATLLAEHKEAIDSITAYLRTVGGPLEDRFELRGNYADGAEFSERAHSGMLYFANDWLGRLEDYRYSELVIRIGDVLGRVDYIHELFTELSQGNDYIGQHLGKQFPVKFRPGENPHLRQHYHYFAYFPKNYPEVERLPTILWLPWVRVFEEDINGVLEAELPKRLESETDYPFLVISVWNNGEPFKNEFLRQVYADVVDRFKVDTDRVILTGASSGGAATWRWACEDPELFAAAVPVSGVMPHYEIQCLTQLPIWLFNNEQDNVWTQEIAIEKLKDRNPDFKATIYEDAKGHNAWTAAYTEPELTEWMLRQVRQPVSHPPNPLESLKLREGLSEPVLKELPSDNLVRMAFERADVAEKPTIEQLHAKRYGFTEASTANHAIQGLYPYFRQLGEPVARPMVQLVGYEANKLVFALPVSELRKGEITEPFEFEHFGPSTALTATYVSRELSSEVALLRLRSIAKERGYRLSGKDRVVYLQPVSIDRYVMELQVGVIR